MRYIKTFEQYLDEIYDDTIPILYHGTNDNELIVKRKLYGIYTTPDTNIAKRYKQNESGNLFKIILKQDSKILNLRQGDDLVQFCLENKLLDDYITTLYKKPANLTEDDESYYDYDGQEFVDEINIDDIYDPIVNTKKDENNNIIEVSSLNSDVYGYLHNGNIFQYDRYFMDSVVHAAHDQDYDAVLITDLHSDAETLDVYILTNLECIEKSEKI